MLNSLNNLRSGNRMVTSVNADPPSELITRIQYQPFEATSEGSGAGADASA
jgi:hypothetical protein